MSRMQFSSLLRGGQFGASGRKGATSVGRRQPRVFAGIDVVRSQEWNREGLIARIGSPAHLAEMTRINAAWVALTDGERQGFQHRAQGESTAREQARQLAKASTVDEAEAAESTEEEAATAG